MDATTAMHLALECAIDLARTGLNESLLLYRLTYSLIGDERAEELFGRFLDESRPSPGPRWRRLGPAQ